MIVQEAEEAWLPLNGGESSSFPLGNSDTTQKGRRKGTLLLLGEGGSTAPHVASTDTHGGALYYY